jgi:hypothetical protein
VENYSRYLCKKCHTPFHLDKAGAAVIGDPPSIDVHLDEAKQKLREAMEKAKGPAKKVVAGVSALVVVWLAWYVFFGPADRLESSAKKAGAALAANDLSSLKAMAAPGTADDVGRWFDEVHGRLAGVRGRWHGGKDEAVEVHVGQEDPTQHKGSAGISIHPALAGGLDVSLANPSAATAGADAPFDVETHWALDRWGHWKLDGRETYAKVQPTTVQATHVQAKAP